MLSHVNRLPNIFQYVFFIGDTAFIRGRHMLAINRALESSHPSIVTLDAVLSAIEGASPPQSVPKWSPHLIIGSAQGDAPRPVLDRVVAAMAGAGHSVAALSFYVGLRQADVRKRVGGLGPPPRPGRPLRRLPAQH